MAESPRDGLMAAAIQLAGAVLYLVAVPVAGLTFDVTPLFFGCVLGLCAPFRRRDLAPALLLGGWGAAVLLTREGPLPRSREGAAFLVGFGLGAGVLVLLRRLVPERVSLESAATVLLTGGVAYYFAFDLTWLAQGWIWAAALGLNGVVLGGVTLRAQKRAAAVSA